MQELSVWASGRMGEATGTHVVQGASTSGVYIYILFIAYVVFRFASARPVPWASLVSTAAWLTVLLLGLMAYGPVLAVWGAGWLREIAASNPAVDPLHGTSAAMLAAHAPLLYLAAASVVVAVADCLVPAAAPASGSASADGRRWDVSVRHAVAATVAVAACLGAILVTSPCCTALRQRPQNEKVVFYRDARDALRTWDVPSFDHLGLASAGMFGLFPEYLRAWGYQPVMADPKRPLEAAALADAHVLVVINLDQRLSRSEHQAVWNFVERGGGLLVLGDHTDLGGTMEPQNDLLAPVGIRLNFDAAFTPSHWINVVELFPHPVTVGLDYADERLQHSTGASLSLPRDACPVVAARWGFSDTGNRANRDNAFLGDYVYQFDERLGDVVVIAEAAYGRGRVLVFGDTSSFQNNAIPHSAPFLYNVMAHLAADRPPEASWRGWAGAGLLATAVAVALIQWLRQPGSPRWFAAVLVPLAAVLALRQPSADLLLPKMKGPVAYVEAAHVNRFSLALWQEDSIGGLLLNLARNGYKPLVYRGGDIAEVLSASVFVTIAPSKPFSLAELETLRQFMEGGGLLVVSVGWEEVAPACGLLEMIGVEIGDVPLGSVPVVPLPRTGEVLKEVLRQPHFKEAWPVKVGAGLRAESFYRYGEDDLIIFRPIGNGGALVIGDSRFLHDKTLEAEKAWWEGNIKLLRDILGNLRNQGVGL